MRKRDSEVDRGRRRTSRTLLVWKAAQKMIVAIGIEPTDWFYSSYEIYGGRKGFVDLMLSRDHKLENISVWMGHSTLENLEKL